MANAHSFPFLRLPCLAKEHVIMVMDVREQYFFSTLSKKSKRIARNGTRLVSYAYELRLDSDATYVKIKEDWSSHWLEIRVLKNERTSEFLLDNISLFNLKTENIEESSMKLLEFLIEVFRISSFQLGICDIRKEFCKQFLETVKSFKITVDKLEVGGALDNEMFEWTMENCGYVKRMDNYFRTTPDFQWDPQHPSTCERICLTFSPFLTLHHLTHFFWNCRTFRADDDKHKLTNQDLNQFVKLWMTGDSKLEYIDICFNKSLNFQEVMTDIEKLPVESACIDNKPTHFKQGKAFKIQQHNKKEAVVCIIPGRELIITSHFDKKDCDLWPVYVPWIPWNQEFEDDEDGEDLEN